MASEPRSPMVPMTDTERQLAALLTEGAVYLAALNESAARLGLDMSEQIAPWLDDVASALKG